MKTTGKSELEKISVNVVDGSQARENDQSFALGGHHEVYPWIPAGEIWIEDGIEGEDRTAILIHELVEYALMKWDRLSYDEAHSLANAAEEVVRSRVGVSDAKDQKEDVSKMKQFVIYVNDRVVQWSTPVYNRIFGKKNIDKGINYAVVEGDDPGETLTKWCDQKRLNKAFFLIREKKASDKMPVSESISAVRFSRDVLAEGGKSKIDASDELYDSLAKVLDKVPGLSMTNKGGGRKNWFGRFDSSKEAGKVYDKVVALLNSKKDMLGIGASKERSTTSGRETVYGANGCIGAISVDFEDVHPNFTVLVDFFPVENRYTRDMCRIAGMKEGDKMPASESRVVKAKQTRDSLLGEAVLDDDPNDPAIIAVKMIEENEKLRAMLNSSYDHILLPVFAVAVKKLEQAKKAGLYYRAAPAIVAGTIVPALYRYAENAQRIASETEKKYKSYK